MLSNCHSNNDGRKPAAMQTTWNPHDKHGDLSERSDLPDSVFAFPAERKEPLTDATHVRNAIARFDQVTDVSDEERELAFANIKKAAQYYGVHMTETDWHDLGAQPHTGRRRKIAESRLAPAWKRNDGGESCPRPRTKQSKRSERAAY